MSNELDQNRTVLFFGTPGQFSRGILLALLSHGIAVVGIVHRTNPDSASPIIALAPRSKPELPVHRLRSGDLDEIPRFLVRELNHPLVEERLADTRPDVIVTGCFPLLVPDSIRRIARLDALNVHPSLLPRHRGPDPIFWALHGGETETGVSIHCLDDHFDRGPILSQARYPIKSGATWEELDAGLSTLGGELLAELLLASNFPAPLPQRDDLATYEHLPQLNGLQIDSTWTVNRAECFVNGCGHSHGPLSYQSDKQRTIQFRSMSEGENGSPIELADGIRFVRQLIAE